jgi:hypothetical protein
MQWEELDSTWVVVGLVLSQKHTLEDAPGAEGRDEGGGGEEEEEEASFQSLLLH